MDGDRGGTPDRPIADILALPSPDWLYNQLTITGPAADLARFRDAAAGSGVIPWDRDYDALVERFTVLMIQPGPTGRPPVSFAEARRLAERLRLLFHHDDQAALARYYRSRACPFDLHRLLPVPDAILRHGDDAPAAEAWLWNHWGTSWPLRRVRDITSHYRADPSTTRIFDFWSADWSPWRAIASLADAWPSLRFALRPFY